MAFCLRVLLLMFISINLNAYYVGFQSSVSVSVYDNTVQTYELKGLVDTLYRRGFTKEGLSSECEAIVSVYHILSVIEQEKINKLKTEIYNSAEQKIEWSEIELSQETLNEIKIKFDLDEKDYHAGDIVDRVRFCGLYDFKKSNIKAEVESSLNQLYLYEDEPITGNFPAGVRISANNLTKIPLQLRARHTPRATQWVTQEQSFKLDLLDMKAGDEILIWAEDETGEVIAERVVRVQGATGDSRPPVFTTRWLKLEDHGQDNFLLRTYSSLPLGEPNLYVYIYAVNTDSNGYKTETYVNYIQLDQHGNYVQAKLNSEGKYESSEINLPKHLGESFVFKAYDPYKQSWHDVGELFELSELTQDPDNISLLAESDGFYLGQPYAKFDGPLFENGASASDVRQGRISNCYFAGALRAVANNYKHELENNIIQKEADGTYTVKFNKIYYQIVDGLNTINYTGEKVSINVSSYFPALNNGDTVYMQGTKKAPFNMELWGPLMEKAYAIYAPQTKGYVESRRRSYDGIGGSRAAHLSAEVLKYIVGGDFDTYALSSRYPNVEDFKKELVEFITKPGQTSTVFFDTATRNDPNDSYYKERYRFENVAFDHQYVLLDYDPVKGLKLSNPWGIFEPIQDEIDDGVFWVSFEQVFRMMKFVSLHYKIH